MNRRNTQIYLMLCEDKNYSQIGDEFRITRERVRQIAKEYHWENVRFPRPEGHVSIKEYAQIVGIPEATVRGRIKRGMPHTQLGDRIYIDPRVRPVCITCDAEITKGKVYCPACFILSRNQSIWRGVNRRFYAIKGKKIPLSQEKGHYHKGRYAEVK